MGAGLPAMGGMGQASPGARPMADPAVMSGAGGYPGPAGSYPGLAVPTMGLGMPSGMMSGPMVPNGVLRNDPANGTRGLGAAGKLPMGPSWAQARNGQQSQPFLVNGAN